MEEMGSINAVKYIADLLDKYYGLNIGSIIVVLVLDIKELEL